VANSLQDSSGEFTRGCSKESRYVARVNKESRIDMKAKKKADLLYDHAVSLHGYEKAKQEAINSANAVRALIDFQNRAFWDKVLDNLKCK
jgi:hypothetical protein